MSGERYCTLRQSFIDGYVGYFFVPGITHRLRPVIFHLLLSNPAYFSHQTFAPASMPQNYTLRPSPAEHGSYFGRYIRLVPEGDIIRLIETQAEDTLALFDEISEEQACYRYALEKWSIKEIVGHLVESEQIFVYRALRFSRNEQVPLPGFDQDAYVEAARFDRQPFRALVDEFRAVRKATVLFFQGVSDEMMERTGIASDTTLSVRAVAYILAGHERHHVAILRERYLS